MPEMPTSFRLDAESGYLLDALEKATGQTATGVLRLALRYLARREGVALPTAEQVTAWDEARPRRPKKQQS